MVSPICDENVLWYLERKADKFVFALDRIYSRIADKGCIRILIY